MKYLTTSNARVSSNKTLCPHAPHQQLRCLQPIATFFHAIYCKSNLLFLYTYPCRIFVNATSFEFLFCNFFAFCFYVCNQFVWNFSLDLPWNSTHWLLSSLQQICLSNCLPRLKAFWYVCAVTSCMQQLYIMPVVASELCRACVCVCA